MEQDTLLAREWQHIQDVQQVFGTDAGRRVLTRLQDDFGRMSFDAASVRVTDFREGQRHVLTVLLRRQAMTQDMLRQHLTRDATGDFDAIA